MKCIIEWEPCKETGSLFDNIKDICGTGGSRKAVLLDYGVNGALYEVIRVFLFVQYNNVFL